MIQSQPRPREHFLGFQMHKSCPRMPCLDQLPAPQRSRLHFPSQIQRLRTRLHQFQLHGVRRLHLRPMSKASSAEPAQQALTRQTKMRTMTPRSSDTE